ncbi:hypothetical protein HaLaN_19139, partial [Haematococcus lacustris]
MRKTMQRFKALSADHGLRPSHPCCSVTHWVPDTIASAAWQTQHRQPGSMPLRLTFKICPGSAASHEAVKSLAVKLMPVPCDAHHFVFALLVFFPTLFSGSACS